MALPAKGIVVLRVRAAAGTVTVVATWPAACIACNQIRPILPSSA